MGQGWKVGKRTAGQVDSNICRQVNCKVEGRDRTYNRDTLSQGVEAWMTVNETETRLAMTQKEEDRIENVMTKVCSHGMKEEVKNLPLVNFTFQFSTYYFML